MGKVERALAVLPDGKVQGGDALHGRVAAVVAVGHHLRAPEAILARRRIAGLEDGVVVQAQGPRLVGMLLVELVPNKTVSLSLSQPAN